MITFHIGQDLWRLRAEELQWTLERQHLNKKSGKVEWRDQKYYSRAEHAADKLTRLGATVAGDLESLLELIGALTVALRAQGMR